MTIRTPAINEWALTISSAAVGTGVTVTPGQNTYGSYVQMLSGAAVTDDAYGVWFCCFSTATSAVSRNALMKIGMDPAGGSSYADTVMDLAVASASSPFGGADGIYYYFPIFIQKGTSIAAALSVNATPVGIGVASCRLQCRPSHPELVRAGRFVRTFGSTPASSSGTPFTPGTDTKGSYVQLGSALVEPLWYWGVGIGIDQTVFIGRVTSVDLAIGNASNKRIVIPDMFVTHNVGEAQTYRSQGASAEGCVGDLIYARAHHLGAPASGWSATAYAVGG